MAAAAEGNYSYVEESTEEELKKDPELILDVLSYVFQFCDLETLKQCRLVKKSWHKAAAPHFRDKTIWDPVYTERLMHCNLLDTKDKEWMFDGEVDDEVYYSDRFPFGFPYGTIRIPYVDHPSGFEKQRRWFRRWGPRVRGLVFYLEKDGCIPEFAAMRAGMLIDIVLKYCKNLLELEIVGWKGIQDADFSESVTPSDMCRGTIKRLKFKHFEATEFTPMTKHFLSSTETKFRSFWKYYTMGSVLQALSKEVEVVVNVEDKEYSCFLAHCLKNIASNIKSIVWKNRLHAQTLYHLRSELPCQAIKMKTIDLSCGLYPTLLLSSHIQELVKLWGPSLKVLKIKGKLVESWTDEDSDSDEEDLEIRNLAAQPRHFHLALPRMEHLTVFELKDIFHTRIESFDFIKKFPNLRVLKLSNVVYAADVNPLQPVDVFNSLVDSPQLAREPHLNLRVLHLDEFIDQAQFLEAVSKYFPMLQDLHLEVSSDQAFVEVFKRFKDAVRVNLTFKTVTDIAWCQSAFINFMPKMIDLERLDLTFLGSYHPCLITEEVVSAGFKNCKKLRWFGLENIGMYETEYHGIIKNLAQLHDLQLRNCVFLSNPKSISFTRDCFGESGKIAKPSFDHIMM